MPRFFTWILATLAAASLVPLLLIGHARYSRSGTPRLHLIQDMDNQARYEPQAANPFYDDGRAMRRPVEGTIAFGSQVADPHLLHGQIPGPLRLLAPIDVLGEADLPPMEQEMVDAERLPMEATLALMAHGQERFEIFCAPCHGLSGDGAGMVHQRAAALREGTWVAPTDLHSASVHTTPVGQLYRVVAQGKGSMPAYGPQLSVEDRWAVVAYLRALQRSQRASLQDVPEPQRQQLLSEPE